MSIEGDNPPCKQKIFRGKTKEISTKKKKKKRSGMGTHLVLDESSQGEVVKQVSEVLPDISSAVLSEALVIETVPTQPSQQDERVRKKLFELDVVVA